MLTSFGRGCWFPCGQYHGTEQQLPLQGLQDLCSNASVCQSGGKRIYMPCVNISDRKRY